MKTIQIKNLATLGMYEIINEIKYDTTQKEATTNKLQAPWTGTYKPIT